MKKILLVAMTAMIVVACSPKKDNEAASIATSNDTINESTNATAVEATETVASENITVSEDAFTPQTLTYLCDDNVKIQVTYPDKDTAEVTIDNETLKLTSTVTASGARYAGQGYEWATKNDEGMFTSPVTKASRNCRAVN